MRPCAIICWLAGVPIESSKGEAEAGQEELNIRYADALDCADHHTIAKHAIKEIAWQHGLAASFLPKWHQDKVGSSSHVHQSLWKDGKTAFLTQMATLGMSELMEHYMAGLMKYAPDYTYFLAPYINSYKRFAKGTFAPTQTVWSVDNRTAGFRLCGDGTKGVRIECRIGGSDLNPYLAQAAMLAAGLKGIEEKLHAAPPTTGDAYRRRQAATSPHLARCDARPCAICTCCARRIGEDVVDHYARAAEWEMKNSTA